MAVRARIVAPEMAGGRRDAGDWRSARLVLINEAGEQNPTSRRAAGGAPELSKQLLTSPQRQHHVAFAP